MARFIRSQIYGRMFETDVFPVFHNSGFNVAPEVAAAALRPESNLAVLAEGGNNPDVVNT